MAPRSEQVSGSAQVVDGILATRWDDNRCAAGALSEVLTQLGDSVTEGELSSELTRARRGGVVSVDLLLAARRRGYDARLVAGTPELLRQELLEGRPLILMLRVLDAPGVGDDLFHYVVLSGIDPATDAVRMHFGDEKRRWASIAKFSDSWEAAGNATLLVRPRTVHAATEDDLRRAVLLEEAGNLEDAIDLYEYFLTSHPESVVGWTNLANAQARLDRPRLAEHAYRNALHLDSSDRDSANNLAWLLLQRGRLAEAETYALRAAEREGPDHHIVLETLAAVLAAQGRCDEAVATLERAAAMNSTHASARSDNDTDHIICETGQ